jgi:hypothetical protein
MPKVKKLSFEDILEEFRRTGEHLENGGDACECREFMLACAADVIVKAAHGGVPLAIAVPVFMLVSEFFYEAAQKAAYVEATTVAQRRAADALLDRLHLIALHAVDELPNHIQTTVGTREVIDDVRAKADVAEALAAFRRTEGGDA